MLTLTSFISIYILRKQERNETFKEISEIKQILDELAKLNLKKKQEIVRKIKENQI